MDTEPLSQLQIDQFHSDGFLLVEQMLDTDEAELLQDAAQSDERLRHAAMDVKDASGRCTNLSLWNHPGEDIYGMIARSARVVGAMQQLLQDEVYHYHSKLSVKEPQVGGAWEWHQDYGYWYHNGCLFPDMASVFIAVDACTRENGCMQVLRGSHLLGRIEHGRFGEQAGADPIRVAAAKKRLQRIHCEMAPGDGLYFHANLLHASEPNQSRSIRRGLLCCYNTRHNDPYRTSHHPRYTPIQIVEDSSIRRIGAKGSDGTQQFLVQDDDHTTG